MKIISHTPKPIPSETGFKNDINDVNGEVTQMSDISDELKIAKRECESCDAIQSC